MSGSDLRVVLVGWGAIGRRVAELLRDRAAPVRIVAVAVRETGVARADLPDGAALIRDPEGLAMSFDLLVEAAGRASVADWARAALGRGASVAVSSTSALTDAALLAELLTLARARGGQVLIPPGALGGIDSLAAAARLPLHAVRHEVVKPALAWIGTPAAALCDLASLGAPVTFFEGSAREAADAYPQNANVAVISALAGIGLDRTVVALIADPAARFNSHRLIASGDFGRFEMRLENQPLPGNPKSSGMTALSLVRLIENRIAPLVI